MTPQTAIKLVDICFAFMFVMGIVGTLNVYIDMNNKERKRKCLVELITTIAVCLSLLATAITIQNKYLC